MKAQKSNTQQILFRWWMERIACHPMIEAALNAAAVCVPSEIVPQSFYLSRVVKEETKKLLSSHIYTKEHHRVTAIQLVINVANSGKLSVDRHSDISSLSAAAVSFSWLFAKKVLTAIKDNEVEKLYHPNTRSDSILITDWPQTLEEFVLRPENSRPVPGNEQVSIRYGTRHAKHILLKSKSEIIENFKAQFPQCTYRVSTLKREFPPYAVKPTTRNLQRNTPPIHANIRHLVKGVNSLLKKWKRNPLPISCRQLALTVMCDRDFTNIDPLTWNEECSMRRCESCPELVVDTADNILQHTVNFVQWESRLQNIRNKKGEEV